VIAGSDFVDEANNRPNATWQSNLEIKLWLVKAKLS
jgi:hypothetical protein